MKKMKLITIVMAIVMALGIGCLATGCSGGGSAAPVAKDGCATSQEVCDGMSKAFEKYFASDFTTSDTKAFGEDILKLMPEKFRTTVGASDAFTSGLLSSMGDTSSIKEVLDFCKFEISFSLGKKAPESTISTLNSALKEVGVTDTVTEAYTIDMNMKLTLTKDYMGVSKGTVIGEESQSMGSSVAVVKIGDRWFFL